MSEFEQDYIMRQIKNVAGALAKLIFNRDTPAYTFSSAERSSDGDILYLQLTALLSDRKVNEAENLLFASLDDNRPEFLSVAIDFYSKLDEWTEEGLEDVGFSRKEIREGLLSVMKFYRVSLDQIVAYFPSEDEI